MIARALRFVRIELGLFVLYVALHLSFAALSADDGMISPSGSVRPMVLLVGVATLAVRVAVLFFAAPILAYRASSALLARART